MPLINRCGGGSAELQSGSATPTTAEKKYTPDDGFDGYKDFTVGAIPSTYVSPSLRQSAQEWTPTIKDQSLPAGTYCTGKQTFKGDANLVAANIKSGVSIFGVTGSYSGTVFEAIVSAEYDDSGSKLVIPTDGIEAGRFPERVFIISQNADFPNIYQYSDGDPQEGVATLLLEDIASEYEYTNFMICVDSNGDADEPVAYIETHINDYKYYSITQESGYLVVTSSAGFDTTLYGQGRTKFLGGYYVIVMYK